MDEYIEPLNTINRQISSALYKKGDPSFHLLDIKSPFRIHLVDGRSVLGYFTGYGERYVSLGTDKIFYPHWRDGKERVHRPTYVFNETRFSLKGGSLFHDGPGVSFSEGLRYDESFRVDSKDRALELINGYLEKRSIVEVVLRRSSGKNRGIVGFIGDSNGEILNLAHSVSESGEYDNWFSPGYIPADRWCNPERNLALDRIVSISTLQTFFPEPDSFSEGILDFPLDPQ